jgi:predicted Zn-dependent protease
MTYLAADDTPNRGEPSASQASDSLLSLLTALREQLLVRCNTEEELKTLCADLGVNYDDLPAQGREAKAREFVAWLDRHHRTADLQAILARPRPITTPAIDDYLTALRNYCDNLPYLTLHDIRPPKTLDEVYVPLKARPQPRKDEKPERDGERAMRELERSGPLSIAEVMRQRNPPHVLILGEPGAGKSTLLRQLAEHAWDAPDKIGLDAPHLPILVPLRRLAAAEGVLEERLNRALAAELTLTQALPQGFFTNWPKQTDANWLILLDALDEVPAEQRPQLMQWLRGLLNQIGRNRVILASRPSGYSQGELDDKQFSHYGLLSFTPDQTGEFAHKWFGDGQGTGTAEQFLKELDRVRVSVLSGTPLLLTIAAKVYLEKGTLPERRSGLYGQFVDIWLGEAEQRGMRAELGDPVCGVAKFALAHLALAMTEQPAQSEAWLTKVVASYLKDVVPFTPERAEVEGERFLRVMARRSGVFIRRGGVYDFSHSTFREYLAAEAIVRECGTDYEKVWNRVVSHWAEPRWHEVALFVLSILSDQGGNVAGITTLVQRISTGDKSGLYFAGEVLRERITVHESLGQEIICRLSVTSRPWEAKVDAWANVEAAVKLSELGQTEEAVSMLLILAYDEKVSAWVRLQAAEALGRLGRTNEAASILLALGCDEKVSVSVRGRAAWVLGQLKRADEATQTSLALARDEKADVLVRERAAEALGELGRADEATQAWLALAHDAKVGAHVHERAAEMLVSLKRVNEAVSILLALARDQKVNVLVRERAAETLVKLGWADEAVSILLALARDEKVDVLVRERAAEALGKLGRADEAAQAWLALAHNAKAGARVCERAIKALGKVADDHILLALEQIIQEDKRKTVRRAAQRAIEQICERTEHNRDDTQTTSPPQG